MLGKNGNDNTNISADILLVFVTSLANLSAYNANGDIEVWRNTLSNSVWYIHSWPKLLDHYTFM